MFEIEFNYLAILVSAIATMALGFVWYGPILFAKPWMKLMGLTVEKLESQKKEMGKTYGVSFVGALVTAFVLACFISYAGFESYLMGGVQLGFLAWLGFVAPVQLTDVLFGGKPLKLYYINTGYQLVSLLIMGAILATWS